MNKARILIVDDEAVGADDLRRQLVELGYEPVGHTTRGAEAILLAGQLRPDLVLMDISLAGERNSLAVAQAIRDQFALPVVFLTEFVAEEIVDHAKLPEPFGYLSKPFDRWKLAMVIEMAIYKQSVESQFQAQGECHRFILKTAMDGFWLADPQGRLLEVNETYCQMSGYSAQELLTMRISDLETVETPTDIAVRIRKIITQGEDRFEARHRRKDGSVFEVEISVQYQPADGRRLVVFLRDITERRRVEEDLRGHQVEMQMQNEELRRSQVELDASRARYFDLFDFAPVGYVTLSEPGLILEANVTVASLLGVVRGALIWKPFSRFILKEDTDSYFLLRKQLFATDAPQTCELRMVRSDGTPFWVHLAATAAQDAAGAPVCRITLSDITARKQSELELRESESKFRLLAENIQDVFWLTTPALDQMLYVSPAFEKIWGRTCASLFQQPLSFAEAIHPEDQGRLFAAMQDHAQSNWEVEYRIIRPDGALRWILDRGFFIRDEHGAVTLLCGVAKDITQRKQAAAALNDANWRMASIIEGTHVGTWEWNIQTGETVFNQAWAEIIGYTLEELAPISIKTWEMYVHPEDRTQSAQLLERHFAGELPYYDCECRMKHKAGHWVWVHDRGRVITRTNDGQPLMMFGTHADISARKQAEAVLRGSEARFRAVTDSATDAIISADSAGTIVGWNRGAERIFGYTEAEVRGQPLTLLMPSRNQDGHLVGMARMQARGELHVIGKTVEVAGCHKDGHEFPLDLSLGEWQVAEGYFYTAIIRDISARKQAEEKLRELSLAVEQSPVSVVITDPAGNIEYVNPKFVAITGYSVAEVLGQNPRVLKSGATSPEGYRDLWQTITAGKEWRGELHNRKKNGELFWESVSISPIRDPAGRITRFVAIKEDITASKQAEEERGQMEMQLRQAQRLESIGQLAAGIAHEINTPTQYIGDNTRFLQDAFADITKVLGVYDRLLQAARQQQVSPELVSATAAAVEATDIAYLTEEVPKSIEQTLQGVARVTKIVRAMKDFSHPGSEEKVSTDLNHAIESTVTVAHNEWKYVAELDLVLDPQLPRVSCLPAEINQVILNLVINAAHAISDVVGDGTHGTGRIRVSTSQQGEWAEIRVQDTGTGIPEAARGRIFDPFFTTKAVGKGTGQGLTIAHLVVVKQHGGTIEFETELGKGTTFIVRLPFLPSPAPATKV